MQILIATLAAAVVVGLAVDDNGKRCGLLVGGLLNKNFCCCGSRNHQRCHAEQKC